MGGISCFAWFSASAAAFGNPSDIRGFAGLSVEELIQALQNSSRGLPRRSPQRQWPKGHLQPFGSWRSGIPVEERTVLPSPYEFYRRYSVVDGGAGRPVVLKGAARRMRAMEWSDSRLLMEHGSSRIWGVEPNLKETRRHGLAPGFETLGDFVKSYNASNNHLISPIPFRMQRDIEFLPFLSCGGFLNFLGTHRIWLNRGGSRSVVHRDDAENVNCLLAGEKQFALVHPDWRSLAEAHPNVDGLPDRFGFIDARFDEEAPGYGAYFGRLDVDAVDLLRFPGWRNVPWYRAHLQAGDCIYIPHGWYHQVRAALTRTLNVHVWYWRPAAFDQSSCPSKPNMRRPRFADCTWGYEPPAGDQPLGVRHHRGKRQKLTFCGPSGRHRVRSRLSHEL